MATVSGLIKSSIVIAVVFGFGVGKGVAITTFGVGVGVGKGVEFEIITRGRSVGGIGFSWANALMVEPIKTTNPIKMFDFIIFFAGDLIIFEQNP